MASGGPTIEIRVGEGDKEKVRQFAGLRGFIGRGDKPDMTAYILHLVQQDMERSDHGHGERHLGPQAAAPALQLQRLHPDDAAELQDLNGQLHRVGVLLNQVAKAVNTIARGGGTRFDAAPIEAAIGNLNRIGSRLDNLFTRIGCAGRGHAPAATVPEEAPVERRRGRSRPVEPETA